MTASDASRVAIVDYGMGNLYSVQRACVTAGLDATVTNQRDEILTADSVILPGVGAFPDAMRNLSALDLVPVLRDVAHSGTPLIGICLGMQLLLTESEEFVQARGLDLVPGSVRWLGTPREGSRTLKVPEVGWNAIRPPHGRADAWPGTVLEGTPPGVEMYFVHSLVVVPEDSSVVLSRTTYGDVEFCSTLRMDNVIGFQYHPERSGKAGLRVYERIAEHVRNLTSRVRQA